MAKKSRVNKTAAVREYLKSHPAAVSSEIAAALNKQGIKITPGYVANIKTKHKLKRTAKKAAAAPAAMVAEAPGKLAKPGDVVTLQQIKAVAHTASTMGGFRRLRDLLELIRDVGGAKKFNDLVDAMAATDMDAIPF